MELGCIAIITDDPGWHGKQLVQAFKRFGYGSRYVSLTQCKLAIESEEMPVYLPGFESKLPDAVFVRGVPGGSLQQVVFYLDILHALRVLKIPVYNDAKAIERSVDKGMTSFLLQQAGINTPQTWVLGDREQALSIVEEELNKGHSIIRKPLFGSQGEGVWRLEKTTDLLWLTGSQGVYYLQRFVDCESDGYSDIRVFVINGQAVSAMQRCGRSWLNNVARGARCVPVKLDQTLENIAVQSCQELEMDYGGVDIIKQKNGQYTVIEVNSIPAWKGLESVSTINIADHLAEDLIKRYLQAESSNIALVSSC